MLKTNYVRETDNKNPFPCQVKNNRFRFKNPFPKLLLLFCSFLRRLLRFGMLHPASHNLATSLYLFCILIYLSLLI
jgi:hypothetical protein